MTIFDQICFKSMGLEYHKRWDHFYASFGQQYQTKISLGSPNSINCEDQSNGLENA